MMIGNLSLYKVPKSILRRWTWRLITIIVLGFLYNFYNGSVGIHGIPGSRRRAIQCRKFGLSVCQPFALGPNW